MGMGYIIVGFMKSFSLPTQWKGCKHKADDDIADVGRNSVEDGERMVGGQATGQVVMVISVVLTVG